MIAGVRATCTERSFHAWHGHASTLVGAQLFVQRIQPFRARDDPECAANRALRADFSLYRLGRTRILALSSRRAADEASHELRSRVDETSA